MDWCLFPALLPGKRLIGRATPLRSKLRRGALRASGKLSDVEKESDSYGDTDQARNGAANENVNEIP
jgi:hypothetical protein